jgi:hypothetical protein
MGRKGSDFVGLYDYIPREQASHRAVSNVLIVNAGQQMNTDSHGSEGVNYAYQRLKAGNVPLGRGDPRAGADDTA